MIIALSNIEARIVIEALQVARENTWEAVEGTEGSHHSATLVEAERLELLIQRFEATGEAERADILD